MRTVVAREPRSVVIEGETVGTIGCLVVLLGVTHNDALENAKWLAEKIVGLRPNDADGKMNRDLTGKPPCSSCQPPPPTATAKGKRPSFIDAAPPPTRFRCTRHYQRRRARHPGRDGAIRRGHEGRTGQ